MESSSQLSYSSGTVSGSDNGSFTTSWTVPSNAGQAFPTAQTYNGSVWSKSIQYPIYFYTTTANETSGTPVIAEATTTVSSGAEGGMHFLVPSGVASTYTIRGVRMVVTSPAVGKSIKVVLYSGTDGAAVGHDRLRQLCPDHRSPVRDFLFRLTHRSPPLSAGTEYRIGISPQDASNGVGLRAMTIHDAQALTAFPGGSGWYYSSRSSCGGPCDGTATGWSDTTTARPWMSLIIGDMAGGSGGGTRSYVGH